MPKPKNSSQKKSQKNSEGDDNLEIKQEKSLLSEFVEREVPTEEEVDRFEEFAHTENREQEIDEGLSEIYQNDDGEMVDVQKLEIKKKRGLLFNLSIVFLSVAFFVSAGWFAYNFIISAIGSDPTAIELTIDAPKNIVAGEEFFYLVKYKNLYDVSLNNMEIKITYPENFILLDTDPLPVDGVWKVPFLAVSQSGEIKIKGKIIDSQDKIEALLVEARYSPANFSSEFKKETSNELTVSDIGMNIAVEAPSSVLVGEDSEFTIKYRAKNNNYIKNFRATAEKPENMELGAYKNSAGISTVEVKNNTWLISDVGTEEKELVVKFKFTEKINNNESVLLNFEYSEDGEKYYKFFEKQIDLEIIKSDLSLVLIANGSRDSGAVNFGDAMNYSLSYENRGEFEMKDVVIMAVLEGESLDWDSVEGGEGKVSDNTITWSKQEVPALETIRGGDKGVIDFSIKILSVEKIDLNNYVGASKFEIKSYAQFNIGNREETSDNEDTKSNTIISKINSNLKLDERIRYFNDDNIAVGFGPIPPKVGETTSYKVYWTVTNNLHELNSLRIEAKLPSYVSWLGKEVVDVGSIFYDSASGKVVWDVGRLPDTVYKINAEFSIGITPSENDYNTVKILLSDTTVKAVDAETQSEISTKGVGKTTKLEDDNIAASDGRIIK